MNNITIKLALPNVPISESIAKSTLFSLLQEFAIPTEDILDAKVILGEAVMNCIAHAYPEKTGTIYVSITVRNTGLTLIIRDTGVGIEDIKQARMPLFTTREQSSGMGFTIMESLGDDVTVRSTPGRGTKVTIKKRLKIFN